LRRTVASADSASVSIMPFCHSKAVYLPGLDSRPSFSCRHRCSQGVHDRFTGAPQGGEKYFGPNLQGKVVSAPPGRACTPGRTKVQYFEEIWDMRTVGVANLVVLASVLKATTKKGRQLFLGEGSAPPEKILATPCREQTTCLIKCSSSSSSRSGKQGCDKQRDMQNSNIRPKKIHRTVS